MKHESVGFTGTSHDGGATRKQLTALNRKLLELWRAGYREAHHGDCIWADEQFDQLARQVGFCGSYPPAD